MNHYGLVHTPIPIPKAMKMPQQKLPWRKSRTSSKNCQAWQITKVKSKREVIKEAQKEGRTVHFATLMDICHLKNSELELWES